MKQLGLIILSFLSLLFLGCDKDSGWNCGRKLGETIVQDRSVIPFHSVRAEGKINLIFKYADTSTVSVKYGKNMIDEITTEVVDGVLNITDETSCNWVRDLSKVPVVTILTDSLKLFENRLSGDVTFQDTIKSIVFTYDQWDSNGKFHVVVDAVITRCWAQTGYGDLTIIGRTKTAELYCGSSTRYNALGLKSQTTLVNNSSNLDILCNAENYIYGELNENGNIIYTGDPETVESGGNGSGQIFPY